MTWIRFLEVTPPEYVEAIWMTNKRDRWIRTKDAETWEAEMRTWGDNLNECLWIEIKAPEMPPFKKELHCCFFAPFKCQETEGKSLLVMHGESWAVVKMCPICGYCKK